MAAYSEQERRELLEVPITDILTVFGRSTAHSGDNLYYSPFRDEATPSFHISRDGRKWYDFGSGKGGSVLTLVCMLLGCDGGKGYDFLASVSRTYIPSDKEALPVRGGARTGESHIKVFSASKVFRDLTLVEYASERGVNYPNLVQYCREITFGYENHPAFRDTAIGFPNNRGGWVLRAPDVKRCTCSDITTIDIYGEVSDSPTSPAGIMFEGFFDFLTYMEISRKEWPECDVCILNSVQNIGKAQSWISSHKEICTFFDNDDAGRKALQEVESLQCVKVNDWSGLYAGYNDLSDRWKASTKASEMNLITIQYQSLWNKTFQKTFRID